MSDFKLFEVCGDKATELEGTSVGLEKSLQAVIEHHLETFFGIRFLASEYNTGKKHGGRIDTLGLDEDYCPIIIEYKRSLNENVINQGLFYLDWLMDHKAEFQLLVQEKLGKQEAETIEWGGPRLLCIAGDFTKYDEHAVQQINRNIELIRYKRYGKELLLFDLVNAVTAQLNDIGAQAKVGYSKTVSQYLSEADDDVKDLFEATRSFLLGLGDDVQMKPMKFYFAFKRFKNFACVEVKKGVGKLQVFVKVDPGTIHLEEGFTRDVRKIGHYGTGDLEISIHDMAGLEKAKDLLIQSYEAS